MSDLDYVGEILTNALKFKDSGFNPTLSLRDTIEDENVAASEMFKSIEGRWHLRSVSLPGDISICAVAVDQKSLLLETAPFNMEIFGKLIEDFGLPFSYEPKNHRIVGSDGEVVLTISAPKVFIVEDQELSPRCLCRISLTGLNEKSRGVVVSLVDKMFTAGVFVQKEDAVSSPAMVPQIRLDLSMSLVIALQLIQQPIMSLREEMDTLTELKMGTQMTQIQALLAVQRRVLGMSREELVEFTAKQVAERGERDVVKLYSFIIAGRVKIVRPKLSWKDARRVAAALISKPFVPC